MIDSYHSLDLTSTTYRHSGLATLQSCGVNLTTYWSVQAEGRRMNVHILLLEVPDLSHAELLND